ncbi:energy-coupling factor transporter transmembrane component T [Nocardioides sp.]|uniref:energy-coupling factor transporter transmembrane component T family protein n=1 Tax=Nocardioides sp. TaxID=35761 RepID=UPI002ED345C7
MSGRLPRDLHPVAWWTWAVGLAAGASLSTNPVWMVMLVGAATVVVLARRSDQPWARSFRLYCLLALVIVVLRVVFRIVFGGGVGDTVLVELPEIPLPGFVMGIQLFGDITLESLLAGLYDGLRLAAIVICIGAANSLANPKRLLKSLPPALYEIGTAMVIAVTMVPQLADSVRRVRRAQALRGGASGRVSRLRRVLVPVLEDAFDRSLRLAAGMDTRGYGRSGDATPRQRRLTGALMLAGLCGICLGSYLGLDQSTALPVSWGRPLLLGGLAVAIGGIVAAGRRVHRSRYRPDPWRWPELSVIACGLAVAVAAQRITQVSPTIAYPPLTAVPTLDVLALVAVAVAVLPAVLAPPPTMGLVVKS